MTRIKRIFADSIFAFLSASIRTIREICVPILSSLINHYFRLIRAAVFFFGADFVLARAGLVETVTVPPPRPASPRWDLSRASQRRR